MTKEHIKEELSARCIEALANYMGFVTESHRKDYGIDLTIREIAKRIELNGKETLFPSNRELKVQLKATTEKQVRGAKGVLKFDLKVKNYNDLVYYTQNSRPMYLFLIVMPDDEERWLEYTEGELILRSRCYWYTHPLDTVASSNSRTQVIQIPENQMIKKETFTQLLNKSSKR